MKQGGRQLPPCGMPSGSPTQPSPNRNVPCAKLFPANVLIDCPIAIDPIEYIGLSLSFDDFKPDSNIVDNDGMPGKPFPPNGSVLGCFFHLMILSFGSRMKRTEEPCVGAVETKSWIGFLFVPILPDGAPRTTAAMPGYA